MGLDSSKFRQGQKQSSDDLRKTKEDATTSAKSIEASGKNAAAFFSKLRTEALTLFAVFTAGRGLKDFIRDITGSDAATSRLAHNLGMSTDTLSEWEGAAQRTGGSAAATAASFDNLTQQIQEFSLGKGGESIKYFRALGVQIADASGKMRPMNDILLDLADKFSHMDPRQAITFGRAIGLDDGTINLLEKGRAGVEALLAAQKRLGVANDADGQRAQQLQNSLLDLQQAVTSLGRTILNDLSPTVIQILSAMDDWIQKNREWLASQITAYLIQFREKAVELFEYLKTVDWSKVIADAKDFAASVWEIIKQINDLVEKTTGWTKLAEVFFAAWAISKFAPLISAFTSIASLVLGVTTGVVGLTTALAAPALLAGLAALAIYEGISSGAGKEELDKEKQLHDQNMKDHPENIIGQDTETRSNPFLEWYRQKAPSWMGGAAKTTAQQDALSKQAMDYFTSQGWTPQQSAGIVGNLQQESSFDEKAGAGTAHQGLAQWSSARQADIEAHFGKKLMSMSYAEQLAAVQWELTAGRYKNVGDKLHQATSYGESATIIDQRYESPGNYEYEDARRSANAGARLKAYQGNLSTGAAPSAIRTGNTTTSSNSNSEVHVNGPININTKATDAKGIAVSLRGALRDNMIVSQANFGLA